MLMTNQPLLGVNKWKNGDSFYSTDEIAQQFPHLRVFHWTWVEPRRIQRPIRSFSNASNGAFYFLQHLLLLIKKSFPHKLSNNQLHYSLHDSPTCIVMIMLQNGISEKTGVRSTEHYGMFQVNVVGGNDTKRQTRA